MLNFAGGERFVNQAIIQYTWPTPFRESERRALAIADLAIRITGKLSQRSPVTSGVLGEMRGTGSTVVLGTVDT